MLSRTKIPRVSLTEMDLTGLGRALESSRLDRLMLKKTNKAKEFKEFKDI